MSILDFCMRCPDYALSFEGQQSYRRKYNDEYILYTIVSKYLKLGKGKICAQVGHGVHKAVEYMILKNPKLYKSYINDFIKITLKVNSEEEMMDILQKTQRLTKFYVVDAGRTQCPKDSLTAVTYLPMPRHRVPDCIQKLGLY